MTILVTGGTGYIGAHTTVQLIEQNHEVVIIDNLSNSTIEPLRRIEAITGVMPRFYQGSVQDSQLLQQIFQRHNIEAVIHFAGAKSVGESVADPLAYYHNNIASTVTLCQTMSHFNVFNLVFSSSAAVYGNSTKVPVIESMTTQATSPYGRTKLMIEQILEDLQMTDSRWSIARLRYFNPIGAHYSGLIGEDPQGLPSNLVPYICQVALGSLDKLSVFGDDYDTPDGTGIRDFIHVADLADAHEKAIRYIANHAGLHTFNLGTGRGYSVLEMICAFEQASSKPIPYIIQPRREGDIGKSWACAKRAKSMLGWQAQHNLQQMLQDAWRWQKHNPEGYKQPLLGQPISLRMAS